MNALDPNIVGEWLRDGKLLVDLTRTVLSTLPRGKNRDELEGKLADAEASLARSNATLANALGYHLCQCSFPPQIMLWKETRKSYACPNPECSKEVNMSSAHVPTSRLGPNGWMGV